MTMLPPDWRVATSAPPWADGKTRFGVWPVPGPTGWLALTLAAEPVTRDIEGKIDGQTVLYCPMPRAQSTTASVPWPIEGHEIVVYAEILGAGRSVRCDVFVDGRSLTTGESMAEAILQRAKASAGRSPVVTAANLIWMIPFLSLFRVISLPTHGSGLVPLALVGALVIDFGVTGVAYLTLNRLLKLGFTGRRGLAAAAVIYVATFAAVMLVYGGALVIVRG
ncbi:MAG TPA: hypothetical protein VF337_04935 [Candidatus Limnocylindrales bacterium]